MSLNLETKFKDVITLWKVSGSDGTGGDTFQPPVTFKGRWEEINELFKGAIDKKEHVSSAIIYLSDTPVVNLGDYLAKGDHLEVSNPADLPEASKIQTVNSISNMRGTQVLQKAML